MSKITVLEHLKACAEEAKDYAGGLVSKLAKTVTEAIEELEQAQAVMEKLLELYPDTPGTLHLENYDPDSGSIRFVPAA